MGSLNNWLGFSLSPNLTVDMQETSQSQTASTVATGSMVHSNVVQASIGFGRECYELHPSDNAPASLQMPEMTLRSDGSLYILDSFNRTTQNEDWHLKSLEHSRSMGAESDLQTHEHLINADLSMLVGGNSSSRYDHISSDREGPKLEDFLGGASLGGGHDYSDHSRSETPQTQTQSQTSTLENMYGATPTFGDGDHLAMKMIVPPDSRLNCFPAFDIADSELSSAANSSKRSEDQTLKPTASCVSAVHSSSLREPYDHQNSNDYLFPDCSLQLPQSSGVNNMNGLSMIKTWLRTHPSAPESKINYGSTCETMTTTTTTTTPKDGLDALTNIQTLSLSMTPSSQSSSLAIVPAAPPQNAILDNSSLSDQTKKRITPEKPTGPSEHALRKSIDTFGQRTSIYRGVTRHRWTGRYEAHLWDNSCRREGQTRKGRQVYLGGYDKEEKAARSYDLAALKYWGQTTTTNFPISNYEKELDEMKHMTRQEYVASLRRKSSGFSRGASIYRGVTRHHQHGRWQARIGRVAGNKDLYLGTFSTQEEAAEAYDIAAIKFRGLNAVTNFDMSRYDVKSIIASSTLPVGGHVKRLKEGEASDPSVDGRRTDHDQDSSTITSYPSAYANSASKTNGHEWPIIAFQQHAGQQRTSWCKQEQDNRNQDLQVQLHSLHHQKYVQQSSMMTANATVLHNLMSLQESAASAGVGETNNTVSTTGSLFSNISANNLAGNGTLLMSTPSMQSSAAVQTADNSRAVAPFSQNEQVTFRASANNYDNMLYAGDPFSRSVYYLPQHQQQSGVAKSNYIDSNPAICNNWMTPAPTQTLAPRPNLAVCHAPIFSIWSDP